MDIEEPGRRKLTLLMTDIEGSTALWDSEPDKTSRAVARHDEIISSVVSAHGGEVVKSRGEGDSFFCVFLSEETAVAASADLQRALSSENWSTSKPIRVRVAIHTGEVEGRGSDYYGPIVNRCARLRAVSHGGQVIMSGAVRDAAGDEHAFRDHGRHRLKDLLSPEHIFELAWSDEKHPPLASLNSLDHNLPIQLTTFVGRAKDVEEAGSALSSSRLITMTGVGGAGKTRLALQVAAQLAGLAEHTIRFVSLADLPRDSDVGASCARGVGAEFGGGMDPVAEVIRLFKGHQALIVIDNCEHVANSAAEAIKRILAECPLVKIIATSRAPLLLVGERNFSVEPLSLPRQGEVHPLKVLESEAAALFIDRVRQRRARFVLDAASAPLVAQLVRALDGIPLAIEQAAARVGTLGLDTIIERLSEKLDVLRSVERDAEPRHRTVRATLEWSHELLSPDDRKALARFSTFQGVFTTKDASVVCSHDAAAQVESLVQQSMVAAVHTSSHDMGYRLLETVKDFGREHIPVDAPDAYERHMAWALGIAEWVDETIETPASADAFVLLDRAYDDLIAALSRAIREKDERALRLAFLLRKPWLRRGPTMDGVALTERAIEEVPCAVPVRLAELHNTLGAMATQTGLGDKALLHLRLAATEFEQLKMPLKVAGSMANMGILHGTRGEFSEAKPLFESCLAAYRSGGDFEGAAKVSLNFGRMLLDSGQHSDARVYIESALDAFRGSDPMRESLALINLAAALPSSELSRRLECLGRSLEVLADSPDHSQMSVSLKLLAAIATEQRRFSDAATLLALAEICREEMGTHLSPAEHEGFCTLGRQIEADLPSGAIAVARSRARAMGDAERIEYAKRVLFSLDAHMN